VRFADRTSRVAAKWRARIRCAARTSSIEIAKARDYKT